MRSAARFQRISSGENRKKYVNLVALKKQFNNEQNVDSFSLVSIQFNPITEFQ